MAVRGLIGWSERVYIHTMTREVEVVFTAHGKCQHGQHVWRDRRTGAGVRTCANCNNKTLNIASYNIACVITSRVRGRASFRPRSYEPS